MCYLEIKFLTILSKKGISEKFCDVLIMFVSIDSAIK